MPEHVHLLLSEPQPEAELDGGPRKPDGGPLKPGVGLSGDVHWLSKPQQQTLADALKSLKQGVSRRLIANLPLKSKPGLSGPPEHFWQKRYYDFNIRNYSQFVEKLRYIHRNPVNAELCARPEEWPWSSFRHYATGVAGRVEIESEWTTRKRERAAGTLCPAVELPPQVEALARRLNRALKSRARRRVQAKTELEW